MLDLEFAFARYFGDCLGNEDMNALSSKDGQWSIFVYLSRILWSYAVRCRRFNREEVLSQNSPSFSITIFI
jgi:hypothetical protein